MNETKDFDVPNPKNKNSKAIRVLLAVFCLLIICTGVSFYIIYNEIKADDPSSLFENPHRTSAPQNGEVSPEKHETIEYNGKTYVRNDDIINLLFLGIDSDASREERNMGYRSDMVLVCALDTAAKKVTLISFPRDTYTTVYNINADTGEIQRTRQNRVNAAFAFGGGPNHYGYQNAMACVELFLQRECELKDKLDFTLDIPVYLSAGIDMDGIIPVADSVGGIEVTLEYSIPGVGNKGQTVLLKGEKAETYLRDRHHTPGGDLGRAEKEQDFMIKLAKKIKSMGAVDIIVSLYDDLQNYVDTNLNTTQMADLAKILMGVDLNDVDKYIIPGKGGTLNGAYFYMPDEQAMLELLLKVYYKEAP